jgi:hypothetical protein
MAVRILLLILIINLWIFANAQAPKRENSENFASWICRKVAWKLEIYRKLVAVRQIPHQVTGTHLAVADIGSQSESVRFECGTCWSPAVIDGFELAVLKSDGLYAVPASGPAMLVVPAEGLRMIVGRIAGAERSFLVLRHKPDSAQCTYTLAVADLVSKSLKSTGDGEPGCLVEAELNQLARPDTVRETRVLPADESGRQRHPAHSGCRH